VGPRAGLDRCGKSRPYWGFVPRTVQPVARPIELPGHQYCIMTHEFLYQNYFTRNIITLDDGSGCYVRVRGCTGQKWRGGDIQLTVFLADWQHKAWFNSQRNVCSGVASPLCIHINAPYACYQEQFRTASECFSCH